MKLLNLLNVGIIILIINNHSLAQNYNDALLLSEPGLFNDARALSMGNSFSAISNDFAGVLFNPAGLGLINKTQLTASMNINSFNNQTTFFNLSNSANKTSTSLNQFGIVYPLPTLRGSWVFALGYNKTKDFNQTMEFDGFNPGNNSMIQSLTGVYNEQVPITNDVKVSYEIRDPQTQQYLKDTTIINGLLNQSGKTRQEGNIGKWSFATSVEFAKGLFVGGTFNIINGNYKSNRDYWEDDTRNYYGTNLELVPGDPTTKDFQTFYLNDVIDWDLSGWDAQIGILYNWLDKLRFGASVKFPSYFTVKENYLVNVSSYFGSGYQYDLYPAIDDPVKYQIKTPFEYTFAASSTISLLTISADLKIMDYTEMKFTDGFDYSYRADRNREIQDLFTTTLNYHLGAEFNIPMQFPFWVRAGVMYLPSLFANDPSEFDKKILTFGAGTLIDDTFGLDLAFAHGWWKDFGDNYGSNVSRTYQDITTQNVILNFTANF